MRAVTDPPARHSPWKPLAVVLGLTAFAVGTYWSISRARARELEERIARHGRELVACVPSERELSLRFSGDHPAAECAAPARALADAAAQLARAPLVADAGAAKTIAAAAERLRDFAWDASAKELAHRRSGIDAELALICPGCEPRRAPALAPATTVADLQLDAPPLAVVWNATAAIVPSGPKTALVAIGARTKSASHAFVARSLDAARSWQTTAIASAGAGAELRAPALALLGDGSLLAAHFARRDGEPWRVAVSRWNRGSAKADSLGTIELPAGADPVSTGSPILPLVEGFALSLVRGGRSLVLYVGGKKNETHAGPEGTPIASTAARPARVVATKSSKTGFVELTQRAVPAPGDPWGDAITTLVSYVSELSTEAAPDQWCGLPGEQFFTFLGKGPKQHVLVASGPRQIFPLRFTARPGASLSVLCGPCPPAALERSREGVRVMLPVRRQLAPASVDLPIAFDSSSIDTAVAACTGEQVGITYRAGGSVLFQTTRGGKWKFERPTLAAEPNEHGSPAEVAVLGFDDRMRVLWRRAQAGSRRILIEASP